MLKGLLYYYFLYGKEEFVYECIQKVNEYIMQKFEDIFVVYEIIGDVIQRFIYDMVDEMEVVGFMGFLLFSFWVVVEIFCISY